MSRVPQGKKRIEPRLSLVHLGVLFCLAAFLIGVLFVGSGFYVRHWTNSVARTMSHIIPLPVASVNGDIIYYDDVAELALFFETNGDDDPFVQALETTIRRKEIEQLALELTGWQNFHDVNTQQPRDEELMNALGWNDKQYEKYIIIPLSIATIAESSLYDSEKYQAPAHLQAEGLMNDIELGIDFTDLARQHSDGGAAYAGGDIGYVTKDQLEPGLETLFNLEPEETSVILEADRYFAIGKAYDVIYVDDVREQVGLQIISVNKLTLADVLENIQDEQKVKIWLR